MKNIEGQFTVEFPFGEIVYQVVFSPSGEVLKVESPADILPFIILKLSILEKNIPLVETQGKLLLLELPLAIRGLIDDFDYLQEISNQVQIITNVGGEEYINLSDNFNINLGVLSEASINRLYTRDVQIKRIKSIIELLKNKKEEPLLTLNYLKNIFFATPHGGNEFFTEELGHYFAKHYTKELGDYVYDLLYTGSDSVKIGAMILIYTFYEFYGRESKKLIDFKLRTDVVDDLLKFINTDDWELPTRIFEHIRYIGIMTKIPNLSTKLRPFLEVKDLTIQGSLIQTLIAIDIGRSDNINIDLKPFFYDLLEEKDLGFTKEEICKYLGYFATEEDSKKIETLELSKRQKHTFLFYRDEARKHQ